jgi:lysozyme
METNDAGINLIKEFEGLRLNAYQDVAGIWTIGYGHIRTAIEGMIINLERALELLKGDLKEAETYVTRAIAGSRTTSNQFSAMVSLAYNIGIGNFGKSTVLREHKAGNHQSAARAFLLWDKATIDGQLTQVAGLARRRESERQLYLTV